MERDLSEYLDKVDAIESQVEELINQLDSAYDERYAVGYNKAIDEFVKKLIARLEEQRKKESAYLCFYLDECGYSDCDDAYSDGKTEGIVMTYDNVIGFVDEIAEQLKKGGEG